MNINSPTELYHFLINNGISNISPEAQSLISCIGVLGRMCPCESQAARQQKVNQCKQNYIAFASRASSHTSLLLSKIKDNKIVFYLNGQPIGIINR